MHEAKIDGHWSYVSDVDIDSGAALLCDGSAGPISSRAWEESDFKLESGLATVRNGRAAGFVIESGGGDGSYEVWVRRESIDGHDVITGLFVDFACSSLHVRTAET